MSNPLHRHSVRIEDALRGPGASERIFNIYRTTPEGERDAFVLALAFELEMQRVRRRHGRGGDAQ